MLDLVRLSSRPLFSPGGVELYRQIGRLTGMEAGQEVLVVASGRGVTPEFFVREYGVQGSGVDFDPAMVEAAEDRARNEDLADRLQYQHSSLERLPYRDEIFHVALAELSLTAYAEPGAGLRELVRVTKPGGRVVLVQPVWKAPVDETRRELLSEHLGCSPLMLVEWKRLLREEGVGQLHTEDWTDEETAFRPQVKKPFPDFKELFGLWEKLVILRRARRRWGWKGVWTALRREREVHRLLTRERILGLDLVMGIKEVAAETEPEAEVPEAPGAGGRAGDSSEVDAGEEAESESDPGAARESEDEPEPEAETVGLPLFSSEEGEGER